MTYSSHQKPIQFFLWSDLFEPLDERVVLGEIKFLSI